MYVSYFQNLESTIVILYINRLKKKAYLAMSINTEKIIDNIQHLFIILEKNFQQMRNVKNIPMFLNLRKDKL